MRRFLLFAFALTFVSAIAWADNLTPEQALSRFRNNGNTPSLRMATANKPLRLAHTVTSGALNTLYIYNNTTDNGGFVILPADNCAPVLLGYSETGTFNIDNMPANFKAWIEGYSRQIAAASQAAETSETGNRLREATTQRSAIEPLLATQWNQGAPYSNNMITLADGSNAATGCVATAMAQVMNYYEWPATGNGSHRYSFTDDDGVNRTLYMDFSKVTFDWDNMADTYDDYSTEAQNTAVATLMEACGISVDMVYGYSSAAFDYTVPYALYNYFGYDVGARYEMRSVYTNAEWEDIVYGELEAERPVLYGGGAFEEGAHEFVCDGYDGNGYYHFNWGWGGYCDGYFLLTALTPYGSGDCDFSTFSSIVTHIQKPQEGSTIEPNWTMDGYFICDNGNYCQSGVFNRDDAMMITARKAEGTASAYYFTYINCWTPATMNYRFGLKLVDTAGETTYVYETKPMWTAEAGYYYESFNVKCDDVENGQYIVTPAVYADGLGWYDIKIDKTDVQYLVFDITDDKITVSCPDGQTPELTATLNSDVSKIVPGATYSLNYSVNNSGTEYFQAACAYIVKPSEDGIYDIVGSGYERPLYAEANSTTDYTYISPIYIDEDVDTSDELYMVLVSYNNTFLSELNPVHVGETDLKLLSISVDTDSEGYNVPEDSVYIRYSVNAADGPASTKFTFAFTPNDNRTDTLRSSTLNTTYSFSQGQTRSLRTKLTPSYIESLLEKVGGEDIVFCVTLSATEYELILPDGLEWPTFRLVGSTTGIEIVNDEPVSDTPDAIYTLDGSYVGKRISTLKSGVYLIRYGNKTRKVYINPSSIMN